MAFCIRRAALSSSRSLLSLRSPPQFSSLSRLSDLVSDPSAKQPTLVGFRGISDGKRADLSAFARGKQSNCGFPLRRSFSTTTSQLPHITDPDIESAFKDLMAMSWDELPDSVVNNTKKALSKATEDKAGQEALANVFRAAVASVEFGGVLVSLRMALDDLSGITGENIGRLPDYLEDAMKAAYKRYMTYLESFGPDETYLKKKVENELGTKMIHLKMRCSGIGSEWGKVTLLGTSGISGSYVEQRA